MDRGRSGEALGYIKRAGVIKRSHHPEFSPRNPALVVELAPVVIDVLERREAPILPEQGQHQSPISRDSCPVGQDVLSGKVGMFWLGRLGFSPDRLDGLGNDLGTFLPCLVPLGFGLAQS